MSCGSRPLARATGATRACSDSASRCSRPSISKGARSLAADRRGAVGTIHTQYVDLPEPLRLDSGKTLAPVRIAYETYGTQVPAKDNVILVCHALSGDAHAAGWSDDPNAPDLVDGFGGEERQSRGGLGWWDGMIGPGKAFD